MHDVENWLQSLDTPGNISEQLQQSEGVNVTQPDIPSSTGASAEQEFSDSFLGSENDTCSSISITTAMLNGAPIDGRTYPLFEDGQIWVPMDCQYINDMEAIAEGWYRSGIDENLYSELFKIPPQSALDVAAGCGAWAIDFADCFPSSVVYGQDQAPTQPDLVPPNCCFFITGPDVFTYRRSFDLIHVRDYQWSPNWPVFFEEVYSFLEPGGYVVFEETRFVSTRHHSSWAQWERLRETVESSSGFVMCANNAEKMLKDAGLIVTRRDSRALFESEDLRWFRKCIDIEGRIMRALRQYLGYTLGQVKDQAMRMRKELAQASAPVAVQGFQIVAQKPYN